MKYDRRKRRFAWCMSLFLFLGALPIWAQVEEEYEEISVFLMVQRVGGIEIPAVYHNQQIYLPIQDLFDFLKIKNTPTAGYESVSGYFINQEAPYKVDKIANRITYGKKVYDLKPDDLVRTETNLYLRSNYFGEVFGLDCTFNFRSLSVNLTTKIELPVIRDMRLEFMRGNINKMKGDVVADTVIAQSHPFFRFGTVDWSVIGNQELGGEKQTRLNLGLGALVAGGELRMALQHYVNEPFTEKQQQYLWRFVNNDRKALKQVMLGKIASQATSSIYNPVVGLQVTNAPTTYRRSFGTYTLSDYTEPDWSVELYVNNVLVDYVKADASGFFRFEVPLMYGSTQVLLRFYGPYGEEKSKEQILNIPYNFLPSKELQYTVSGGMVEDSLHSIFSRANANYGLSRFMTVGAGMEYLSSVTSGEFMPFVNTSLRLGSNLLFSGEYTHGVRGKGILNYRTKKNFQVELNYTRYDPNQTAINFNYLEERKAIVSFPIRARKFSAYSRMTLSQNIMPSTRYSTAEWLLSGSLLGVSTNFTTYAIFPDRADPFVYSNLSLGFRLPGRFLFRPQAQYDFTGNQFMLAKAELEKQFFKSGFLNLSYEYNVKSAVQSIQVGFRYDFSVAQTAFAYRKSNDISSFVESARGSFMFDRRSRYAGASNRSSTGRGGIVILPFLDVNQNGRYDRGESKVEGLRININGGRVVQSKRDTVIRIFDLEPYVSYFIELDKFSFDNIAWQMKLKNMSVVVDPSQFKLVEIPISIMAEAAGMVNLSSPEGERGLGRITVEFYRPNGTRVAKTLSEPDGYFSFLGLPPGDFIARIDTAQLRKLKMTVSPAERSFSVQKLVDGDFVDGLDFVLRSTEPAEEAPSVVREQKPATNEPLKIFQPARDSVTIKKTEQPAEPAVKPVVNQPVVTKPEKPAGTETSPIVYAIQVAASKTWMEPSYFQNKFNLTDSVWFFEKDGWFKYVTGRFKSEEEAWSAFNRLGIKGFVTSVTVSELKPVQAVDNKPVKKEPEPTVPSETKAKPQAPVSNLVYCIQLAASRTYIDPSVIQKEKGLTVEVQYFRKDGWYKYVTGQFNTHQEAAQKMAELGIKGFVTMVEKAEIF